jgi:colanic acid biosynthesis glycosyl transferase WcaI
MKLLVYGLNYAPELTGVGRYTSEMCRWLASVGHQVRVVTSYPHYPDWAVTAPYRSGRYSREQIDGVEVQRCPLFVPKSPSGTGRILSHLTFAMSSAPPLFATAIRFRPDVIFAVAPSLQNAPAALLAARLTGAKAWLHIQDFEIDSAFSLGILSGSRLRRCAEASEQSLLRRFDRVSTISAKMMERLAAKGVAAERRIESPNWVDTNAIQPQDRMTSLRAELGLTAESIVALYSGSMTLKHGLKTLVDSARQLRDLKPELTFVFCGSGAVRNDTMEQARGLSNVRFLDLQPADRLSELLSSADIHLLPQRSEVTDLVLPSKLAPMLASGRPVITMAAPGTQLATEVEGAGIIIPADDPAALTMAIRKLADNAELCRGLGEAARAQAVRRWDMHTILRRLETALRSLIGPDAGQSSHAQARPFHEA